MPNCVSNPSAVRPYGGARCGSPDPDHRVVRLAQVPAGQQQPRAAPGEHPRGLEADPGVAPGDHRRAAGLIRHVRLGPPARRAPHPGPCLLAHPATAFRPAAPAATTARATTAAADVSTTYNVSDFSSPRPLGPVRMLRIPVDYLARGSACEAAPAQPSVPGAVVTLEGMFPACRGQKCRSTNCRSSAR